MNTDTNAHNLTHVDVSRPAEKKIVGRLTAIDGVSHVELRLEGRALHVTTYVRSSEARRRVYAEEIAIVRDFPEMEFYFSAPEES